MGVLERYNRNISALSEQEQERLGHARVTVVGCGGLGGLAIEELARIGVGHLRIIDGDVFEESNLNRQLLCTEEQLGREKALVAAERVKAVNSSVEVDARVTFLDADNAASLLEGSDCIVDCLDNFDVRLQMAHAAGELGIPIAYGAIAGWFGQVCTVFPGDVSFVSIYGTPSGESLHAQLGNLPFTAHSTAAFQVAEAVKVVLGRECLLRNRLLMIDLLDMSFEELPLA